MAKYRLFSNNAQEVNYLTVSARDFWIWHTKDKTFVY